MIDTHEANRLIEMLGRQTKRELSSRGKLETIMFPNSAYENLASIEIFYRYPEIVAAIRERMTPEELGQRAPKLGGPLIPMQFWTTGFEYLWGRQILLGLGRLKPDDRVVETRSVLDFWERANRGYRRDQALCNGEAGHTNRVLSEERVRRLAEETLPLTAETRGRFIRLHAQLLSFLILMNCESRAKYGVTGPYDLGEGRVMIVTDFADLGGDSYPWGMPGALPVSHVTMTIVLEDVRIRLANAGLAYGKPTNFLERAIGARVYASDGERLSPLDVEDWGPIGRSVAKAQKDLYRRFARMTVRDRILAGATVYFWFIRPLAEFAGVDAIDWELERCLELLEVFEDADRADRIFEESLLLPAEEPSSFTLLSTTD